MDSDFCENIDPDYTRTVYNVIINSPIQPQQEKNRSFTTMDMFPTTIASLGAPLRVTASVLERTCFQVNRRLQRS